MAAFDADRLVAELVASPDAPGSQDDLRLLAESDPAACAALLEQLAGAASADQPERASAWLTDAAVLWSGAAGDPKRAAKVLRAAIELSPEHDRAVTELTRLYRDNEKHGTLARILERRAEALAERAGADPRARQRAAEAFTALGDLLREEPLGSPVDAIAAYHRAIATGAAAPETFRGARALYLQAGQVGDALPLFALERERFTDPARLVALHREEAAVRKLAGDAAGASAVLRLAYRIDPAATGLAEELARSILERVEAGAPIVAEEDAEAAEIFAALGEASGSDAALRAAERCFAAAGRWEDAARVAERRGAPEAALELLGRAAPPESGPEDRLRVRLWQARLHAVEAGDARRAAEPYADLLHELPEGADAALFERVVESARGGAGSAAFVAARLESAALPAHDLRALKIAFELAARALSGAGRAAELVRQAEVLVGLGADRGPALRHGEAGLDGIAPADAAPLLERLAGLGGPDDIVDLYERYVRRAPAGDDRALAIDLAARAALRRGSLERQKRFLEAVVSDCADDRALGALEAAAGEADRKRGGTALRGALSAALARADPAVRDGGRTRSALLRRAARIARRDLGDTNQAFEWLGDALFARVEAALDEAREERRAQTEALHRTEAALRDLHALLAPDPAPAADAAPARGPQVPPPPPIPAPRPNPPTVPPARPASEPPTQRGSQRAPARAPRAPRAPVLETRDPFPAAAAPPAPEVKRRLSGEELIADLFETMHALDFCKDSLEAGAFTLQIAMERLGSAAGMVHLYDIDRREFVVVQARGPGAEALRGLRTSDGEPLVAEAMRTNGALVIADAAADPRVAGRRWDTVRAAGAPPRPIASVAAARVAQAGRFLGLLELANLADAGRFAPGDEHALAYIAERFMEFVAQHGVVLGVEGS